MVPMAELACWSKSCWMMSCLPIGSQLSTPHPEPWMPMDAAVKWATNLSKEPKPSSMAEASSPVGLSPPSGLMLVQKIEWFT